MSESLSDTLAEITDRFMIRAGISQRKHFARYLILAEECWEDVFQNTLWVIKSVWLPTKSGNPYNYIQIPSDCQRLLSAGTNDKCGLIQPLFYNNQVNVIAKPTTKKCGCDDVGCNCGGLCESANSLTTTTKLMFTILGVSYYQKCWIQTCPNGDIIEWCETPVKKYNTLAGDSGDFNADYNNDYDIADPPFSAYTIVTEKTQRKVCKLETRPCGCPVESEENNTLFMDCCGYLVSESCLNKKKHCRQFSQNVNDNHRGAVKISDCGTKVYYIPSANWRKVYEAETPDYLLVNYQTTGISCGAETLVPKYARNLMYSMLDAGRKEYNSSYSQGEKDAANFKKIDEKNKIMGYLSPVSLQFMSDVQDAQVKW